MYKKIFLTMLVICSGGAMIAVDYNTQNSRTPDANTSYGRLLSDAYRVILNHERQNGTFNNIDYFTQKANKAVTMYNPRPLTTGEGDINNIKKRQELRRQRFDLERFMNGYAGRIAASDVAMMHAGYDCRVKNIELNPTMDKHCNTIFMQHKQQAETKVNDYLGNPPAPIISQSEPMQQQIPEPIYDSNPLEKQPVQEHIQEQIPAPIPVPQSTDFPSEEGLMEMPQVPKNPMVSTNPQNDTIEIQDGTSNTMPLPVPQGVTESPDYMGNKKFNPLKSIHPSLQNQPEGTDNFGIKPTSKMNVSHNNKAPQFDPIATASINQSNSHSKAMTIPFTYGLMVSTEGKRTLGEINQLLKQGNHTTITIIGHADKGNNDAVDTLMSQKRANHIKTVLQHANPNLKFKITAAGSTQPLQGTNATDDHNRRANIVFN